MENKVMTDKAATNSTPAPLVVTRSFAAPRELVFKAWSSADHIKRWFSPEGCTTPDAEIDFRAGGVFAVCMRLPDGQDSWSRGTFTEVAPPERLAFTSTVEFGGEKKFTAHTTVTFEVDGAGTRLTARQVYEIHDEAFRAAIGGAAEGWRTTLDKLEREVARIQQGGGHAVVHGSFVLERTYAAAPAAVYRALSNKAAKARWFASSEGLEVLERTMEVRPGGREHLKGRWASGTVSTFDAIYLDVVPNARLVYAYEMHIDDRKISVSLATVEIEPVGTGTHLTVTEQGAFLDGYDDAGSREHGTGLLLDRLGAALAG
jgi:uncharacterized protein YndB with AHSA1/START domain